MTLRIRKLSYALGAEIQDFRIADDLSPDTVREILDAFHTYQILLFRDQDISFATHIAFSRHFGELDNHDSVPDLRHTAFPQLLVVTNEGKEKSKVFGRQWHTDHSMTLSPTNASLLHAHQLPDVGGETMFANMYAAYETLSPGMRSMLDPMHAVHSISAARHLQGVDPEMLAAKAQRNPPVAHDVVRVHPETGRKALYVNEMLTSHFENMTREESLPLLQYLYAHSTQPEFVYRHQWRRHDLMIWDNRCTMHYALADYDHGQIRRLYRTTVKGPRIGRYVEAGH